MAEHAKTNRNDSGIYYPPDVTLVCSAMAILAQQLGSSALGEIRSVQRIF